MWGRGERATGCVCCPTFPLLQLTFQWKVRFAFFCPALVGNSFPTPVQPPFWCTQTQKGNIPREWPCTSAAAAWRRVSSVSNAGWHTPHSCSSLPLRPSGCRLQRHMSIIRDKNKSRTGRWVGSFCCLQIAPLWDAEQAGGKCIRHLQRLLKLGDWYFSQAVALEF